MVTCDHLPMIDHPQKNPGQTIVRPGFFFHRSRNIHGAYLKDKFRARKMFLLFLGKVYVQSTKNRMRSTFIGTDLFVMTGETG